MRISTMVLRIPYKDNYTIFASNITGRLVVVDKETEKLLDGIEINEGELKRILSYFIDRGVLVKDSDDEYALMERNIKKFRNDYPLEGIFILTLRCNLNCKYCYQERIKKDMSDKVLKQCLKFIVKKVKVLGSDKVQITFYGGEPLLRFDLIKRTLENLRRELFPKVKISSSVITNGTLINKNVLDFLNEFDPVFQICLDGPKEVHDGRRPFSNGNGSFDVIVEALRKAIDHEASVEIRVNVDKKNLREIPRLLEFLKENGLVSRKVLLDFQGVFNVTPACAGYTDTLACNVYINEIVALNRFALGNGIFVHPRIHSLLYCYAYFQNIVNFDVNGDILACLLGAGTKMSEELKVGNVFNEPAYNEKAKLFFERSPLEIKKCRECKIIGFCGGGCPVNAYLKNHDFKDAICPPYKKFFKDYVRTYVENKMALGEYKKVT